MYSQSGANKPGKSLKLKLKWKIKWEKTFTA